VTRVSVGPSRDLVLAHATLTPRLVVPLPASTYGFQGPTGLGSRLGNRLWAEVGSQGRHVTAKLSRKLSRAGYGFPWEGVEGYRTRRAQHRRQTLWLLRATLYHPQQGKARPGR
jgi:hypothetical protein